MPEGDPTIGDFTAAISDSGELDTDALAISDDGTTIALSTQNENVSQDFCIRWNGTPVGTVRFAGPSPEEIIDFVNRLVRLANRSEAAQGRPPWWSANLGVC